MTGPADASLQARGWQVFGHDPVLARWAAAALPQAEAAAQDPDQHRDWLRHGRTWFAGVDRLPNDRQGRVAGSDPLGGAAVEAALGLGTTGRADWHRAQVSVVYPGYPCQDPGESDANHRFRKLRDAAHVDGLLPVGPKRRRMLKEPHAFILGIPLNTASEGASPLVVWEGSHRIIRAALADALSAHPVSTWPDVDLTEAYTEARRRCFEQCSRVELPVLPGEATLLHRHALHGVAPWQRGASAPPAGRIIAYFRPEMPLADWLGD